MGFTAVDELLVDMDGDINSDGMECNDIHLYTGVARKVQYGE